MKKIHVILMVLVLAASSCSTSQSALNDLRQLSYDINTQGSAYGVKEWSRTANKYYKVDKKIVNYIKKDAYTQEEMEEIGQLQVDCVTGFSTGVTENITNKVNNAASLIKGIINGWKSKTDR